MTHQDLRNAIGGAADRGRRDRRAIVKDTSKSGDD
jgi:hypothetical protein